MNELERYERADAPVFSGGAAPKLVSYRLYYAVMAGLVVLSFAIMAACSHVTATAGFMLLVADSPFMFLAATLAGTIGGIVCMSIGRSRESLALGGLGYALFTLTFGCTTSLALSTYSLDTISAAFTGTAAIMIVFGCAGIAFPRLFARVQGVLLVALLALVATGAVMALLGISRTAVDMAVIVVFCGFIGYDVHRAAVAQPTLANALWYSIELYLDIINVFLRLLSIMGRRN